MNAQVEWFCKYIHYCDHVTQACCEMHNCKKKKEEKKTEKELANKEII